MSTGQGKTWTAHRVGSLRRVLSRHRIRRVIKEGVLRADQVVPGAPHQIRAADLQSQAVLKAVRRTGPPCRDASGDQLPMFTNT